MGRILAIDYGSKRVGLAVTDPLQIIASALTTVHSAELVDFIRNYHDKEGLEAIVMGMPTNLNTQDTNASQQVRDVFKSLQRKFPDIPMYLHDERFTSKMALNAMISAGSTKKDRRNKANIDKVSAAIILQSFLESKK